MVFQWSFFQSNWEVVRDDLMKVFKGFHANGGVLCKCITLVPKKDRSVKVADFRPISLVTCVYKIITKVLSKRLSWVLSDTIFESRSDFVGGRQSIDAALMANEVVEDTERRGRRGVVL